LAKGDELFSCDEDGIRFFLGVMKGLYFYAFFFPLSWGGVTSFFGFFFLFSGFMQRDGFFFFAAISEGWRRFCSPLPPSFFDGPGMTPTYFFFPGER